MVKHSAAFLIFVLASVVTCSGGLPGRSTSSSSSSGMVDVGPEPIFDGAATDECWRSMIDAKGGTTTDAVKGGQFFYPTEGASIPPDPAPTFSWSTPLAFNEPRLDAREPVPALRKPFELHLVANALAHGTPTTGNVSWVFFHIPGHDDVVLFTTLGSWTPDAASWAAMKLSGTAGVTAEIYTAYAIQNRISDGPYKVAGPRHFKIQ